MSKTVYHFTQREVTCIFDEPFGEQVIGASKENSIIITDEQVYALHKAKLEGFRVIAIEVGEAYKRQGTVDKIIDRLLQMEADKKTLIVGIGGGVVTDIAGYVASVYKRGVRLGLVPTTILAMVDAAVGGKNGVDVQMYKNMVGTVYQPEFILYDYEFLETLPVKEWINGFAEVIKHACIRDARLFNMLEKYTLHDIQSDPTLVASLVERNVDIKMTVVTADEFENADRKLLNFGHTIGHAIENLYQLPHGHAVSIGMVAACILSEKLSGFHFADAERVVKLLTRYHLPVDIEADTDAVFNILKLDKKREGDTMQFVLLNSIGDAEARPVGMQYLHENLKNIL